MFIRVSLRSHLRILLLCITVLGCGTVFLLRPQAVAGGISHGLSVCSSVIIPTLFPFLVLGGFLSRSGAAAAIGRRLERPTRWLFGLPGCCAAGIILAFLGGYPAGGAVVGDLVRSGQLSREEGRQMLRFCVCGGPGFIISTVGSRLMHSTAFGVLLFAAHLTAAVVIGLIGTPRGSRRSHSTARQHTPPVSAGAALVDSVTAACQSLLYMCGFILLFAALLALADTVLPTDARGLSAVLACFLEVSCGCVAAAELKAAAPLLLGFAVGFAGLSVHCQVASALSGTGVFTKTFFVERLAHGCLTALLALLFLRLYPLTLPVLGTSSAPLVQPFSGGVGISVFLLILCGIWLMSVDKKRDAPYN